MKYFTVEEHNIFNNKCRLNKSNIIFLLLLLITLLSFLAVSFSIFSNSYNKAIFILQIFILLMLCIIPFFIEKVIEIYNLILIISLLYFIRFGIGALYMLWYPKYFDYYIGQNYINALNHGILFVLLCFLFFLLGYYSFNYSKIVHKFLSHVIYLLPQINKFEITKKNFFIFIMFLIFVSIISDLITLKGGDYLFLKSGVSILATKFSYLGVLLYYLSFVQIMVICILFLKYLANNKKIFLLLALFFLIIYFIYAVPTGSKSEILLPFFLLLIIYSIIKRTPRKIILFIVLISIFFVFPFSTIYRSLHSGSVAINIVRTSNKYLHLLSNFNIKTVKLLFFNSIALRINQMGVVTAIVKNTPRIWNFKMGSTYMQFFISLIPRILWHSKPIIGVNDNKFGRNYGILRANDHQTSVGVTWIGEMFINFGWFGIIIAFLWGVLYRIIYIYFFKNGKPNMLGTLIYSFTLYFLIRDNVFVYMFSGLLKFYVFMFFLFLIFKKRILKDN